MALKFLNKKGWHTGSLRNIENVWKAEQKHDAEQRKLEELRKQIHEEREKAEFRLLQEQAGLVPKQERLDFLYESGLGVGKASASEGFKALEAFPKSDDAPSSSATAPSKQAAAPSAVPGALFEEKPHSANDTWRKLHSDPLLMIRQREQEALARVKNNPVQMAMIRKSVEDKHKKHTKKPRDEKEHRKKHHHSNSKHKKHSSSSRDEEERRKSGPRKGPNHDSHSDSEDESHGKASRSEKNACQSSKHREQSPGGQSDRETARDRQGKENYRSSKYREHSPSSLSNRETARDRQEKETYRSSKHREQSPGDQSDRETARDRREKDNYRGSKYRERSPGGQSNRESARDRPEKENYRSSKYREQSPGGQLDRETARVRQDAHSGNRDKPEQNYKTEGQHESQYKRRNAVPKLSEEERASRLREMQMDAELHEDQRWKRLKKADEADAEEASRAATISRGKNFLDTAQKSVYGTEKGGSASIAESVRRRTHYSQGRSENGNAFRR